MKDFIFQVTKFLIILVFIVAFPTLFYLKRDVYSDFGMKRNYSWKYSFEPLGDINTKKLLASSSYYNSFILGSSRCTSLYACYLQRKISNSKFFHYANWNETIGGIERKLSYLDLRGYKIDNVIIYIDNDYTFASDDGNLINEHYLLSHESRIQYLTKHYQTYFTNLSIDKLNILIGLPVSEQTFPNWESDLQTNDPNHICSDSVISTYGNFYNSTTYVREMDSLKETGFFYQRPSRQDFSPSQISKSEKDILRTIKGIFDKHKTRYYVVITPLYDQRRFSIGDYNILVDLFGKNLYDFSGINDITNNIYNYPDRKHFRPHISKLIADSLLKE